MDLDFFSRQFPTPRPFQTDSFTSSDGPPMHDRLNDSGLMRREIQLSDERQIRAAARTVMQAQPVRKTVDSVPRMGQLRYKNPRVSVPAEAMRQESSSGGPVEEYEGSGKALAARRPATGEIVYRPSSARGNVLVVADLIHCLSDALESFDPLALELILEKHAGPTRLNQVEAMRLYAHLHKALEGVAPEGAYFGAREGEGVYGFWQDEG